MMMLLVALTCTVLLIQAANLTVSAANGCCPPIGPLTVEADVGQIHFRGETAEFYILVSYQGTPIDATINATLYYNGTMQADLGALTEHDATGLYRLPYVIPTDAPTGTYALIVTANNCYLQGTTLKTFLLSSTLTNWNAWIIEIHGDVATIKTDVGTIRTTLESINATLVSIDGRIAIIETDIGTIRTDIANIQSTLVKIEGDVATINTTIGQIQVTLKQINATLTALNETIATIQTDIGTIRTDIEDIGLQITSIKGDIATITTTLGDINGTLTSIQGDIVNIKTNIGEVKAALPPSQTATMGIPIASIFAVIAAIGSSISAGMLLRKRNR